MQAGGHRFDPVCLHHHSEEVGFSKILWKLKAVYRADFNLRSNASIFNKLESRNQQTKIGAWKLILETEEEKCCKNWVMIVSLNNEHKRRCSDNQSSKLYESKGLKSEILVNGMLTKSRGS